MTKKSKKYCGHDVDFIHKCEDCGEKIYIPNWFSRENIDELADRKLTNRQYERFLEDCQDTMMDIVSRELRELLSDWIYENIKVKDKETPSVIDLINKRQDLDEGLKDMISIALCGIRKGDKK